MNIVLASGSPRRAELMKMLNIPELLIIPAKGEEAKDNNKSPRDTVLSLSNAKAAEIYEQRAKDDIVIGADTIVYLDGEILGKPQDENDAASMLRRLSGREHEVWTGISVITNDLNISDAEMTKVRFKKLSEEEITAYIKTGEPMDKAGAYGAQGIASLFVEGINGDFFNVMGLPLCLLGKVLSMMGVKLI